MILENLAGPALFIISAVLMILVVPWERVKELALAGTVIGLGIAFVLISLMQNLLGFWTFHRVDLIDFFGIPFFLSAAWIPLVIAFAHLMAQYRNIPLVLGILVALPLGATFVHFLMLANGMLTYYHWNLIFTFLLSVGIHLGMTVYFFATGRLENLRALGLRRREIG